MGKAQARKLQRRAERAANASTTYWHGGVGFLAPNDLLLPPRVTNDPFTTSAQLNETRADRVYLTTDIELARVFASAVQQLTGSSAVYRAEPIGAIETDPDFPAAGVQAKRAIVRQVVERDVMLTSAERTQRIFRYLTWGDGRPAYFPDGRVCITWQLEALGVTQSEVDQVVERWTPQSDAIKVLNAHFLGRA